MEEVIFSQQRLSFSAHHQKCLQLKKPWEISLTCSKATFHFACRWHVKNNSSAVQAARLAQNQSRLSLQNVRPWSYKSLLSSQRASTIICTLRSCLHCAPHSMILSKGTLQSYLSACSGTGGQNFGLVKEAKPQWTHRHSFISSCFLLQTMPSQGLCRDLIKNLGMQCRSPDLKPRLFQACNWNTFALGVLQREGNVWCAWGRRGCKSTKIAKLAQMCWRYERANHP